jgi:hypothetical protein
MVDQNFGRNGDCIFSLWLVCPNSIYRLFYEHWYYHSCILDTLLCWIYCWIMLLLVLLQSSQPMCLTCIIDTLPTFMLNSSLPKIILNSELMKSCLARFPFDLNGERHSILPLHVIDFLLKISALDSALRLPLQCWATTGDLQWWCGHWSDPGRVSNTGDLAISIQAWGKQGLPALRLT